MKARLWFVLRVLGTLGGLAYIATMVELDKATGALTRIPLAAFAGAIALVAGQVVVGALRWHVLMRAYGATEIPRLGYMIKLYFIAFFYNNYLPGAVAGDVGRGVVAREAFANEKLAGALAVVLVERALGLLALFALLAIGLVASGGSIDSGSLWLWTAIGSAGSIALVIAIPLARSIARFLPAVIAKYAARLPSLRDVSAFGIAILLSLLTQLMIAVAGWLLLRGLAPIGFGAALLVVPLAAATTFLPITVGGAGAREAVYVALGTRLFGMPESDALAASLALWLAHLIVGAFGALWQLRKS